MMSVGFLEAERKVQKRLTGLFKELEYTPKEKRERIRRTCGGVQYMTELTLGQKNRLVEHLEREKAERVVVRRIDGEKWEAEASNVLEARGNAPVAMATLPVGTEFTVENGNWEGGIVSVEGVKHIRIGRKQASEGDVRLINLEVHQDIVLEVSLEDGTLNPEPAPVELTIEGIRALIAQVREDVVYKRATEEDVLALCDILDAMTESHG